ncbi:MAG: GAF domain-containing protein, partial [Myxococcota bacterium]|nr:GAF domain-containing protein [Myxococcota bacterium]
MAEHHESNNQINALDVLYVAPHQLPYQGKADLSYLINAWRQLDMEQFPMMKETRDRVLLEWERRPELHGCHEDGSVIRKHADFMSLLLSIKYSLDSQMDPNSVLVAMTPSTMEVLWSTPAVEKLYPLDESAIQNVLPLRNAACLLILIYRLYGDRLDLSKLPIPRPEGMFGILTAQIQPNQPSRFYRVRVDNEIYSSRSWSVGMGVDGELPELTQEDIDQILTNPFDPDHISSIFDARNLMLNGIAFFWGVDITHQHQVDTVQKQLSMRDSLVRRTDLVRFQDQVREMVRIPDIEIGIIRSPCESGSRRARWQPYLRSLRFESEVDPSSLPPNDIYARAIHEVEIINALQDQHQLPTLQKAKFQSVMILPIVHHDECVGLLECGSQKMHAFDFYAVSRLLNMVEHVATAINHVQEGEHERMMSVIKQTCTAIHPSVEWRFQEMARNYLKQLEREEIPYPEPVVFKQVIPLFGVSDIRSSSSKRNEAIRSDLAYQLRLAADVIHTAEKSYSRPVFDELGYRIRKHQRSIGHGLKSGDETRIYMFLRNVVESAFGELSLLSDEIRQKVMAYRDELDSEVGVVYRVRKSYDESVSQINETIGAYLDFQQEIAQKMIPHYFEKFKTDGVDHNIYVGDALLESGTCSRLALRNLYLWQLMSMCGVVWLMRELKPQLSTPLDTAHLLLVQSSPLNITFQMEEKHFSVDGAYNARYEIVKKRIDKARILETGERLTQPEKIAI